MKNEIKHKGIISDIIGRRIDVSVTPQDACASCKAASMCVGGNSGDKIISVVKDNPEFFETGEEVIVSIGGGMGIKAVILAYILPLVVLMAILLTLLSFDVPEAVSGIAALVAVAVYYVCLYFFRKHIESEIIFKIDKVND